MTSDGNVLLVLMCVYEIMCAYMYVLIMYMCVLCKTTQYYYSGECTWSIIRIIPILYDIVRMYSIIMPAAACM